MNKNNSDLSEIDIFQKSYSNSNSDDENSANQRRKKVKYGMSMKSVWWCWKSLSVFGYTTLTIISETFIIILITSINIMLI